MSGYDNGNDDKKGGGKKDRKPTEERSLIPVTVLQIFTAEKSGSDGDQKFAIYPGSDAFQVKLVAVVTEKDEKSTGIHFKVEDGTGSISVKEWTNGDDSSSPYLTHERSRVAENLYVRIIGTIKEYEGVRSIMAQSIAFAEDLNELTNHFLEVMHYKEIVKKGSMFTNKNGETAADVQQKSANSNSSGGGVGFGGGSGSSNGPQSMNGYGGVQAAVDNDSPLQQAIKNYVKQNGRDSEIGADRHECGTALEGQGYSRKDVSLALQNMCNEGLLYTTVDESKVKCADD
jgi:replication factor A2